MSPYPPSLLAVSLVGAPRNVPRRFSALDAARYISSSYPPSYLPAFLRRFPPSSHTVPTAPCFSLSLSLHLSFLSLLPVYPFPDGFSHAAIPPPRSKGLNRPVQFPTRSASNPRSWSTIARQSPTLLVHVTGTSFLSLIKESRFENESSLF